MEAFLGAGMALAEELRSAAEGYHVKSDEHTILLYEADTVEALVRRLRDGTPVPDNLKGSSLLGPWAKPHGWPPRLLARTAAFHAECERRLENDDDGEPR